MRASFKRFLYTAVIAIAAGIGAGHAYLHYTGTVAEPQVLDTYFQQPRVKREPSKVVVVKIDEETYYKLGYKNLKRSLPRRHYTELLRILLSYHAAGVAFDISLDSPDDDPGVDRDLSKAMRELPVVLPYIKNIVPLEVFRNAIAAEGSADFYVSRDQVVRAFPKTQQTAFALSAATILGPTTHPLPGHDYIDFYGAGELLSYPLSTVLSDRSLAPQFEGKLAFIGYAMPFDSMEMARDLHKTPVGFMFGVDIQATIASNVIDNHWIRRLPDKEEKLILFAAVTFLAFLLLQSPTLVNVGFAVLWALFSTWPGYQAFLRGWYFPGIVAATRVLLVIFLLRLAWDFKSILSTLRAVAAEARALRERVASMQTHYQKAKNAISTHIGNVYAELVMGRPSKIHAPEEAATVEHAMKRAWLGGNELPAGPDDIKPGAIIGGRYIVEERLGQGTFGNVYLVSHDGKRFALKVLKREFDREQLGKNVERFIREIRLLRKLDDPHVIKVFDQGVGGGTLYFVMELLAGETLEEKVRKGRLPLSKAADYVMQVCNGLSSIHAADVLHCDLKSANVIIDRTDLAKICDFGVSVAFDATKTANNELLGSPIIMAPELWREEDPTQATDIYALGVLFYEILTGDVPFDGENCHQVMFKHIHTAPRPPRDLCPDLPDWADDLILRMLAKNPKDRPPSAGQIKDEIRCGLKKEKEPLPSWS